MMSDEDENTLEDMIAGEGEDVESESYDEYADTFDEKYVREQEIKIANKLLYGSPAAKQEIIVQLILLGNLRALNSVLLRLNDIEYRRVMPTA